MIVFLNGQFVSEERAGIPVFDRGFLYGDGLFETMLVANGKPFRWQQHLDRLQRGADFLTIQLPYAATALRGVAADLIAKNGMPDSLLRLTLSRGVGPRGYSPKGADQPTLVMTLHPAPGTTNPAPAPPAKPAPARADRVSGPPLRWDLIASSLRLPANQPLAQFKTCNKLPQILARAEADAIGAHEALLLSTDGFVVEASSSNLFWMEGQAVCTPPLVSGILPGVTRAVVLEICRTLRLEARERNVSLEQLKAMPGVFLSLSSLGVVEAASVDGHALKSSPVIEQIRRAYLELVRAETR